MKTKKRASKQQSQTNEIENRLMGNSGIPQILLKSKKLKPMVSNIPEINSISFLQYFTFPFGPKVSISENPFKAFWFPSSLSEIQDPFGTNQKLGPLSKKDEEKSFHK